MRPSRVSTNKIVIHCSATPPTRDVGAADIDIMHKQRGWQSIGYHVVIKRTGKIEFGESLNRQGAHAAGHNADSVAICLSGGVDDKGKSVNNYTDAQWESLKATVEFLKKAYPNAYVMGHRDLSPDKDGDGLIERHEFMKDCPCFSVVDWMKGGMAPVKETFTATPNPKPKGT